MTAINMTPTLSVTPIITNNMLGLDLFGSSVVSGIVSGISGQSILSAMSSMSQTLTNCSLNCRIV